MHTEYMKPIEIHHILGDVEIKLYDKADEKALAKAIRKALDAFTNSKWVDAEVIHQMVRERHGAYYQTPGYYLRLYRKRMDYSQEKFAQLLGVKIYQLRQMEKNMRGIDVPFAKKIADLLNMDYRKLCDKQS